MTFTLDPRLDNDSVFICDWKLSQIRLHRNGAFPWLILIPRREGMREIIDLTVSDQEELLREIRFASHAMQDHYDPQKLNIANLGNVVPQLHVHVIARFAEDGAWPGAIWNSGVTREYEIYELTHIVETLQEILGKYL